MKVKTDLTKMDKDLLTNLATAEAVMELSKDYAKFEKDKPKRFAFAGLTVFSRPDVVDESTGEITEPAKEMPAVNLIDSKGKMFVSATTAIVNACKDLPDFAAVEIEFKGKEKLDNGNQMSKFTVTLLNA